MTVTLNNILIVEDDFYIRDLYVRELERAKYMVRTADSVKQGLEEIKKQKPNLIILCFLFEAGWSFWKRLKKIKI